MAPERISSRATWAVFSVLLIVFTILAVRLAAVVGPTVDEPTYFNSGRVILNTGWEHPVTRLHGPLPYYLNQLLVGDFPPGGYKETEEHTGLLFRGRLGLMPFGWLALTVVFLWSRRVFGNLGGLFSAALFATSPLMIGYGGLLAVDMVHTGAVLLCLFLLWRYLERPSAGRGLLVGVGLGVAFATKYLALLNGPLVVLIAAGRAFHVRRERRGAAAGAALGTALAITATALVTLHLCYGFRAGLSPRDPGAYESELIAGLVDTPLVSTFLACFPEPYLGGVDYQMSVGEGEHHTPYLNGRFAASFPSYYVWVFLLKTQEWVIALAAWLLVFRIPRWLRGRGPFAERSMALVLIPPAVVATGYLSLFTGLQIGVRYVLPLYPMLFILLGAAATGAWVQRLRPRALLFVGLAFGLLQTGQLVRNWPNLISYFNTSAGGQGEAWRHFQDSNSDWGQLVERGREILEETETEPFAVLSLFSGPRFGRVAIVLRDYVLPDEEDPSRARHWLHALEPVRHVGAAWWLFDVTPEAFERSVAESGDERARADLVVAYLGEDRLDDARRHIALLGEERTAPLRELADLVEEARRPDAEVALLLRLVQLWENAGRMDRIEELAREHPNPALAEHETYPIFLARALVKDARLEEAVELLERHGAQEQYYGAGMLARLYRRLRRHEEAIATLEWLVPRVPDELTAKIREELEATREQHLSRVAFFEALK